MPSAYPAAIGRRLITIPAAWLLFAVAIVLALPALLVAAATDLTLRRTGWPTVRMVAFVLAALWIETSGQVRILWSWVTQPFVRMTWTERNHQLMRWWVERLIGAAERVVGVRWRFDVPDDLGPGPLLAFSQHVSIVDAIAPVYILANREGWYLRYTMTRGLRFGPVPRHRGPPHPQPLRGPRQRRQHPGAGPPAHAGDRHGRRRVRRHLPGRRPVHAGRPGPGRREADRARLTPGRRRRGLPPRPPAPARRGHRLLRRRAPTPTSSSSATSASSRSPPSASCGPSSR